MSRLIGSKINSDCSKRNLKSFSDWNQGFGLFRKRRGMQTEIQSKGWGQGGGEATMRGHLLTTK